MKILLGKLKLNKNIFEEVPEVLQTLHLTNLDISDNKIEKCPKNLGILKLKLKRDGFYD